MSDSHHFGELQFAAAKELIAIPVAEAPCGIRNDRPAGIDSGKFLPILFVAAHAEDYAPYGGPSLLRCSSLGNNLWVDDLTNITIW